MQMLKPLAAAALLLAGLSLARTAPAQPPAAAPAGDIPAHFAQPTDAYDYERREVMIPMRDGVRLHTVIVVPRGAHGLPILLTRTPYNASRRAERIRSPHMLAALPEGDEVFVQDGYIRVFQDIRGKYGSEGDYIVTRPPRGPLNPTATDHTTDAWDTIDWLVRNLPESNGRVGMIGSSYEGFTVAMALLDPHPALRVAAPESPMIDGWMGDDWFHYGAFRQANIGWIGAQTGYRGEGHEPASGAYDDYETFRRLGSAGDWARRSGFDQLPYWRRMSEHPAYDSFWQGQALDRLIAAHPSNVPTMWIQGLWDQEDMYGAVHTWEALKAAGHEGNNWLVMGPWRHSQVNYNGASLGPLHWDGDTALQFRRDVLLPFFDHYLKDRPAADPPRALIYNTGEDHWDRLPDWPLACASGCAAPLTPLYLEPGFGLGFARPAAAGGDSYVSDPAKPVPYLVRPIAFADSERWRTWLVQDQRPFSDRTDVLVYETEPLTAPLRISGAPLVDLRATTTGTDADWVVKLIDVYPDEVPSNPPMGGYQLAISLDIFRGRYRDSFEHPIPIPAGRPQAYRFRLPTANHVFLPGHRIMVQIQSSLFPLYDRNPQTFVPNIFFARPQDYRPATQTVLRGGAEASAILLPVVR
jgi:putative CocE/NonD family hydrolase